MLIYHEQWISARDPSILELNLSLSSKTSEA